jgi:hypothetical protein
LIQRTRIYVNLVKFFSFVAVPIQTAKHKMI